MTHELPVERIIHPYILECAPDTTLHEAAQRMQEIRCSSILVVDEGNAVGIWTEHDALRVDFSDPSAFNAPISSVMSSPVKTTLGKTAVNDVALAFQHDGVRHYLVVDDDGRRLGIISQTDVVLNHSIEHYLHLREVGNILTRSPLVVPEAMALQEAVLQMRSEGGDAAVVQYDDGVQGILTERDVVRSISAQTDVRHAGDLASRPLIAVSVGDSLFSVRNMLVERGIRHAGVRDNGGKLLGVVSFSDILASVEVVYVQELKKALKERDSALLISRRNLHLAEKVIESSMEGVIITDTAGRIQSVNPAFTRLTGYSLEEVKDKTPAVLSSGRHDENFYQQLWSDLTKKGHWQGEIWNRRKNGEIYPELLTITAIVDDNGVPTHYAAQFSDISKLKEDEQHIRKLAYYDALTELPNRRLFDDRLSVSLAQAHRHGQMLAVMYIDLDRFKRINDTLGHAIGDLLLQEVSRRMQSCLREGDTLARHAGDEFIALLPEIPEAEAAVKTARRFIRELSRPVMLEGQELFVTTSIGISFYPVDGYDAETLVKNADSAMYRAKEQGRDTYQLYAPDMNARSFEHLVMENSLRKALDRKQFQVYYQPLVDLKSGEVVGAEALLRWWHPELGMVSPADFIPLAEETGLIVPIGEWVLRNVCEQLRFWDEHNFKPISIAVNLSALQFRHGDLLGNLQALLKEYAIPRDRLALELTESTLMEQTELAVERLHTLRAMGCKLSVDDFGTGYSSLSYLKRFPIDTLKIDRSFVQDLNNNADDATIVQAVVGLAHNLRVCVVAEGVETEGQVAFLKTLGCDKVQGFFYGHPVPADVFTSEHLQH